MKKNIFLSKNRRFITTKKRGRKSKRGKNSKWNKRGKRVKTVNTNMRKNRTKKGRRNIQKGGVWFEVSEGVQKKDSYNKETFWYDLDMNDDTDIKKFNTHDNIEDKKDTKAPAKTWRKYNDPNTGRDYYSNNSISLWELPPPNPAFEHKLSRISALLFKESTESNLNEFIDELTKFKIENKKFDISKNSFHSNGKNQTILYAACITPYVSLDILYSLIAVFGCSPGVKTSDGFYPLGALIASLHDNIKGKFFDRTLVYKYIDKYIYAIKILSTYTTSASHLIFKKLKNKDDLTAYDDFAKLFLYKFISDCEQLTQICKLLLIDDNDNKRNLSTVLFEACSQDNIYPDLIRRLIDCRNNVSEKAIIKSPNHERQIYVEDPAESGYPITALIKSYERIEKEGGGDVTNCKAAIDIVFHYSNMQKIDSEYPGTSKKASEIRST